jgi:hypothetical protein
MELTEVKEVFEREFERMESWLAMWVGTDKAVRQTGEAMALTLATGSSGWITNHGPLQLLYAHGTTSKVLSSAAVGLVGPRNGMKNWACPTLPEIHQLCSLYVGLGFACSMGNLQQEESAKLQEKLRTLYARTSATSFAYKPAALDNKTKKALHRVEQGLHVLGDSRPTWGYAMTNLWRHEVDRTVLWLDSFHVHAKGL